MLVRYYLGVGGGPRAAPRSEGEGRPASRRLGRYWGEASGQGTHEILGGRPAGRDSGERRGGQQAGSSRILGGGQRAGDS